MKYELLLWLKGNLGAEEVKKEIKDLAGFIGEAKVENRGRKKLAYKIKGQVEGYQLIIIYELDGQKDGEFKTFLTRNENVLRYLITKISSTKNKKQNASL